MILIYGSLKDHVIVVRFVLAKMNRYRYYEWKYSTISVTLDWLLRKALSTSLSLSLFHHKLNLDTLAASFCEPLVKFNNTTEIIRVELFLCFFVGQRSKYGDTFPFTWESIGYLDDRNLIFFSAMDSRSGSDSWWSRIVLRDAAAFISCLRCFIAAGNYLRETCIYRDSIRRLFSFHCLSRHYAIPEIHVD